MMENGAASHVPSFPSAPPRSDIYGSQERHHAKALKSVDFEEAFRVLDAFRRHDDNRECADCGAANPEWASLHEGTLVCLACAGVHRCLSKPMKSMAKPEIWKPSDAS